MKKKSKKTVIDQVKGHTKIIAGLISAYGVTQFMGSAMRDFSPDAKGIKKLVIKLGAAAMTGMMIKMVGDYLDGEIDEIFEFSEEAIKKINEKPGKKEDGSTDNV